MYWIASTDTNYYDTKLLSGDEGRMKLCVTLEVRLSS